MIELIIVAPDEKAPKRTPEERRVWGNHRKRRRRALLTDEQRAAARAKRRKYAEAHRDRINALQRAAYRRRKQRVRRESVAAVWSRVTSYSW